MKYHNHMRKMLVASTLAVGLGMAPLLTVQADTSIFHQVINVAQNDVLNMRSGPGTGYPVVASIPHNGRTLITTGKASSQGRNDWVEVVWAGSTGWVNERYLTPLNEYTSTSAPADPYTYVQPSQSYEQPLQPVQKANPVVNLNPVNAGETHSHPANACTHSVTHTHPNGNRPHTHHYSCLNNRTNTRASKVTPQARPKFRPKYQSLTL
ncbi:MAG: SH3 domain-containing protein [Thiothrix sp.]|nr:SH3 domain-containing protein [Thiothrix sp.]HPQ97673.1 SH3 domain-containing protein [Thiolinea sp.]